MPSAEIYFFFFFFVVVVEKKKLLIWSYEYVAYMVFMYFTVYVQSNLDSANTDGSFTLANSKSFYEFQRNSSNSSRKQIFKDIFSFYHEIVWCVYSLESHHRGDSNEYTQHTISEEKIENTSLNYRHLLPDMAPWLTLSGSNYPCLEQISIVLLAVSMAMATDLSHKVLLLLS